MAILDAIEILRNADKCFTQIRGKFIANTTYSNCRCALGVLTGEEASNEFQASDWLKVNCENVYNVKWILEASRSKCPFCDNTFQIGSEMIMHLNDDIKHVFTYRQIADTMEKYPELFFIDGVRP